MATCFAAHEHRPRESSPFTLTYRLVVQMLINRALHPYLFHL